MLYYYSDVSFTRGDRFSLLVWAKEPAPRFFTTILEDSKHAGYGKRCKSWRGAGSLFLRRCGVRRASACGWDVPVGEASNCQQWMSRWNVSKQGYWRTESCDP